MTDTILEIKNLRKSYFQNSKCNSVLKGINACWGENEIIGNNGVGSIRDGGKVLIVLSFWTLKGNSSTVLFSLNEVYNKRGYSL